MRSLSWQKNIFTGLLVSIVVLLLVEALARVVKTVKEDVASKTVLVREEWFIYSPTLGWERKPGYRGVVGDYDRDFDGAGYFAVDSKQIGDATRKKIIFIGDSNTFGFGVPTQSSFVEIVEGLLTDVNTINLGVNGYTSYQGRVCLAEYLPLLKPDMVVASFNFNDRRYVLPPDVIDSAEKFQKVYRSSLSAGPRIPEFLEISYSFRALRRVMREVALLPRPETEVKVDAVKPRVDEDAYRRNLSHIAEETKRLGIPLLFLLLKDNPIESYYLREGIANLTKSAEMAIAHLTVAVESGDIFSDLARIYLKKAYQVQGNTEKAAKVVLSHFPFRWLQGGRPVRLDTEYNEIMRQVAHDYDVELVDAARVLDEHAYDYIDFCHFNADGHRRVGELLATRISQILLGARKDIKSVTKSRKVKGTITAKSPTPGKHPTRTPPIAVAGRVRQRFTWTPELEADGSSIRLAHYPGADRTEARRLGLQARQAWVCGCSRLLLRPLKRTNL